MQIVNEASKHMRDNIYCILCIYILYIVFILYIDKILYIVYIGIEQSNSLGAGEGLFQYGMRVSK